MCCLFMYLMCACVFCRYVYLCTTIMPGILEARKGLRTPWNRCFRSCELPCECWELDPCLLEEQTMLLPVEPSPPHPNALHHNLFGKQVNFSPVRLHIFLKY